MSWGAGPSYLGEKIGQERITYNPWVYAAFHRVALETAPTLVEGIPRLFPDLKTVVDFGCGTGVHLSELGNRGVMGEGFEYCPIPRKLGWGLSNLELKPFDLNTFTDAGRKFDLSISVEVAEHVPPELGHHLVDICCAHAPLVVFTAAHPEQSGRGHIHMQPESYWIERFECRGFRYDEAKTAQLEDHIRAKLTRGLWLADNVGIYEKTPTT